MQTEPTISWPSWDPVTVELLHAHSFQWWQHTSSFGSAFSPQKSIAINFDRATPEYRSPPLRYIGKGSTRTLEYEKTVSDFGWLFIGEELDSYNYKRQGLSVLQSLSTLQRRAACFGDLGSCRRRAYEKEVTGEGSIVLDGHGRTI